MSVKDIFDMAESLGVFEKLKNKLIAQPDPAAKHLAEVLGNIADSFEAVDVELDNYLGLWFDSNDPKQIAQERKNLIRLKGDKVSKNVEKKRVHCHKIHSIFYNYLDKWFFRILNPDEYKQIKKVFDSLSNADTDFFNMGIFLGDWLKERAGYILNLLNDKKYALANEKIQDDLEVISSDRDEFAKIIKGLYKAQGDFIKISQTT